MHAVDSLDPVRLSLVHVAMSTTRVEVARSGISLGSALAIAISWSLNKSVLWAVIHGIFSWFYVIYYLIVR